MFVMGASGIFGLWNWQRNSYSKDILKLEVLGPTEIILGQEIEYAIKYKNNGNFRLDDPELILDPPAHSLADGKALERKTLGKSELGEAIYPGEEKTVSLKLRLLGKEGEKGTLEVSLSYRPKDLKARYESSTTFTTIIKQVPLTLEFDMPTKNESGEDFVTRINYFSNVGYPLLGLRIQVEYPPDFEFVSSVPKSLEKTEWEIPVLNQSQGGRIEISGKIQGEVGQAKLFKAKLGVWQGGEFILLKEAEKGVELIKPSLYIRQEINNNPEYLASPGDWLHYEIYFKNIGEDDLNNLFLISKLDGEAFDFSTIKSDLGNYQAGDNSIVFDWRRFPKLQYLPPMEEGKVDFWVKLKDDLGNVNNPTLTNKIFLSQVRQEFTTKISSKLDGMQRGYFQDEVFGNSGPMPPQAGQTTTYTVIWQVKNYYSDVKNVKMMAVLPAQVILTGRMFPEEGASKFSFDSQSREIVWQVGDLKRGEGVFSPSPNITFQVSLTPESYQRGRTAEIVGEAQISGEDGWTENTINTKTSSITTALPDDKSVSREMGIVQ